MNTSKTLLAILVEELPKRGGWPKGVAAITQDSDAAINTYNSVDGLEINAYGTWHCLGSWIDYCITAKHAPCLASDYATAIITHDQYEAALAATGATTDGWIEWAGGECPVSDSTMVEVRYRDGQLRQADRADSYEWGHGYAHFVTAGADIIAYRLHQPQDANSRANDDRLAQHAAAHAGLASTSRDEETDLNDCIGQAPCAPQWDGQGLPPVGVEFEYGSHRSRARCLAIGLHYVFASKGDPDDAERDYEELLIDIHTSYHLARSADEIKRDADIAVLASDIDDSDEGGDLSSRQQDDIAKHLYAAGYRKQ